MPANYPKEYCGDHDDMYCKRETTQGQGPEDLCNPQKGKIFVELKDYFMIEQSDEALVNALYKTGPLSACLDANMLQWYSGGIFNPDDFWCSDLNHAVLITGFGVDNGTKYYSVKNSWTERWGEKGYFRIAYNKCGINTELVQAVLKDCNPPPPF